MIDLQKLKNDERYFDKCIKSAISLISTLDVNKIGKMLNISKQNCANILSQISANTLALRLVIDNAADIEKLTNIVKVSNLRTMFCNEKFNIDSIVQLQDIMKTMVDPLVSSMEKVESMYGLKEGDLSLYNFSSVEQGINFVAIEDNLPAALTYYEGKLMLKAVSDMFNIFSTTKSLYDAKKGDNQAFTVNSIKNMIQSYVDNIDSLVSLSSEFQKIIDSSSLAVYIYTSYNLDNPSNKDAFLNRAFVLIKQDILLTLR